MKRYKSVDEYLAGAVRWQDEIRTLCDILRATDMLESIKWGSPCYTYAGQNVVGIGGFKSYFGLWFHQGALLKDERKVLVNAQEGKTRALRQWRMTSAKDIKPAAIRAYVAEAMDLARDGRRVAPARNAPVVVPPDLEAALGANAAVRKAFAALRQGQQREYADYIATARREATRQKRIEKILPLIAAGAGLNDRYR